MMGQEWFSAHSSNSVIRLVTPSIAATGAASQSACCKSITSSAVRGWSVRMGNLLDERKNGCTVKTKSHHCFNLPQECASLQKFG
jgi:hypothetical protein